MTAPDTSNGDTYHIVCHDCATEFLTTERSEAEQRLSEHRSSTGHDVEFASLARRSVEHE